MQNATDPTQAQAGTDEATGAPEATAQEPTSGTGQETAQPATGQAANGEGEQTTTTAESPEQQQDELTVLRHRLAELEDRHLRLHSEFDNFRRRTQRERAEYGPRATAEIITSLLPVVDDLERAVGAFEQTNHLESLAEGVRMVNAKLQKTLEQHGVRPMACIGEPFDADLHEALTQAPAPTPEQQGKVLDQITRGYMIGDRVLRHAKVVIGS